MSNTNFPQYNHIPFSSVAHVQEICAPLKYLGIDNFIYYKRYGDGEFVDLFSDPYWAELYFKQLFTKKYAENALTKFDKCMVKNCVSWNMEQSYDVWLEGKNYFGYCSGLSICTSNNNSYETFCFFSYNHNHAIEELDMNYIEALKYFSSYFTSYADPLIKQAEKNKLTVPDIYLPDSIESKQNKTVNYDTDAFLKSIDPSVLNINGTKLSKRELECAYWLLIGKNADEIAQILSLSKRTIEHRIESMKNKFGCFKSTQLVQKLQNSSLKFFFQHCKYT